MDQTEEILLKQFYFANPDEAYQIYKFLLNPASLALPFYEFLRIWGQCAGDIGKAIGGALNVAIDDRLLNAINVVRQYRQPNWQLVKSLDLQGEYLDGDQGLYQQFKDCSTFGLIKAIESPGKHSQSAYFLDNGQAKLFVKPVSDMTMAKNEYLVYKKAQEMGLEDFLLPTCIIKLNNNQYASVNTVLKSDYMSLQDFESKHPGSTDAVIAKLAESGSAHKLALLDILVKNGDRHKGNIFFDGKNVKLIDNALSFESINGYKKFVPGYLRKSDWKKNGLPKTKNDHELRNWVYTLDSNKEDWAIISDIMKNHPRLDEAINIAWLRFTQS